jgi:hypothetical protein
MAPCNPRARGHAHFLALASAALVAASTPSCSPGDGLAPALVGYPIPLPSSGGGDDVTTLCSTLCALDPRCVSFTAYPAGCSAPATGPSCALRSASGALNATLSCASTCVPSSAPYPPAPPQDHARITLTGPSVTATLGAYGLVGLTFSPAQPVGAPPIVFTVEQDTFALAVDGVVLNSTAFAAPPVFLGQPTPTSALYGFSSGIYNITVLYDVAVGSAPGSMGSAGLPGPSFTPLDFVKKSINVSSTNPSITVVAVNPFDTLVLVPANTATTTTTPLPAASLSSVLYSMSAMGGAAAFSRLTDGTGLLLALTNTFLNAHVVPTASRFTPGAPALFMSAGYAAGMAPWFFSTPRRPTPTAFECDAGIIGGYRLTHRYVPLFPVWAPAPPTISSSSSSTPTPAFALRPAAGVAAGDGSSRLPRGTVTLPPSPFLAAESPIAPHDPAEVVAIARSTHARTERVVFPRPSSSSSSPSPSGGPANWTWANGYLATGYDSIPPQVVTVQEAWSICAASSSCVATTFASPDGDPTPSGAVNTYFKDEIFFVLAAGWVTWFNLDNQDASLDYAERDALRMAAEAHVVLPPNGEREKKRRARPLSLPYNPPPLTHYPQFPRSYRPRQRGVDGE